MKELKPGPRRMDLKKNHRPRIRHSRAQTAERLVSIPHRLADARSAGARARARAKSNEANFARDQRCGVEVHWSEQRRWPDDEHRLPSDKAGLHLGGRGGGRRVAKHRRGPNVACALARPRLVEHRSRSRSTRTIPQSSIAGPAKRTCRSIRTPEWESIARTNGGKTWKLLASSDETGVPTRIGVIAIDPFNSKHLRSAASERTSRAHGRRIGSECLLRLTAAHVEA